jgi:single-strand DNA-binding protein
MNFNKAIVIGNLTANPETRNTTGGQTVTNFSVATNRVWNNPQGQKQEQVEFHNIVAWGKLAEIAGQYLAKGRMCMVEGRLQTRTWDDQAGVKHWKTEIVAENIQLGPRPSGEAGVRQSNGGENSYGAPAAPQNFGPIEPTNASEEEIKIEDIPF